MLVLYLCLLPFAHFLLEHCILAILENFWLWMKNGSLSLNSKLTSCRILVLMFLFIAWLRLLILVHFYHILQKSLHVFSFRCICELVFWLAKAWLYLFLLMLVQHVWMNQIIVVNACCVSFSCCWAFDWITCCWEIHDTIWRYFCKLSAVGATIKAELWEKL